VQEGIGPISLSTLYRSTSIPVESLPTYSQTSLEDTINADDLSDAERIVDQLSNVSTE